MDTESGATEPRDAAADAAEAVARDSYGKLIAYLAARSHDVAGAEDALSEAFAAALVDWPRQGVPRAPEAWLLTVARRKRVDAIRHQQRGEAVAEMLGWLTEFSAEPDDDEAAALPDRRLGLLFACAHPAIEESVRAPLMLQVVLGFDAATIASAFLVAPTTMGQRLSRAKAKIRDAGIGFEVPPSRLLVGRLDAVLQAVYAAYAEAWTDPEGADPRRRNLADEAIWLGRLLASLLPEEPEALGLLSLMLHAHARRDARRDAAGEYVPLAEQDPRSWDATIIDEAEDLLRRASRCGSSGRFQLEAAVQSAHAVQRCGAGVYWHAIERLYAMLCALTASPVAALNRAVVLAQTQGAADGLRLLDELSTDPHLADYQPYWAARAEVLGRAGRSDEAASAYRRAIGLEADPSMRCFLMRRAGTLVGRR